MSNPSVSQRMPIIAMDAYPCSQRMAAFRAAGRSLCKNSLISDTCWPYHVALSIFTALMFALMLVLWGR
ncbi:MAG TPA: hypothetical protein V6D22_12525 [Candidatus Obscuribacterales bacterium]